MTDEPELAEIAGKIWAETYPENEDQGAILFGITDKRDDAVWLPKSQLEFERTMDGKNFVVTLPEWLATKEGLV